MQGEESQSRRAHHLKPSRLYKYLPPEGLIALASRSLKCTRPAEFSDLRDSFHVFTESTKYGTNVIGSPFYFLPANSITHQPSAQAREELRVWTRLSTDAYPGFALEAVCLVPAMSDDELTQFRHGFRGPLEEIGERYVLCLSEKADSFAMWDYYAAGHRGFVLGFSSDAAFLHRGERSALNRVMYTDQVSTGPWEVALWRRWIIKQTQYSHEQEWRAMYGIEHLRESALGLFVKDFDDTALVDILVGGRADTATIDAIFRSKPEMVAVRQAYLSNQGTIAFRQLDGP